MPHNENLEDESMQLPVCKCCNSGVEVDRRLIIIVYTTCISERASPDNTS